MKLIRNMDIYFLSDVPEEITLSDRLWFYGAYGIIVVMCMYVTSQLYY